MILVYFCGLRESDPWSLLFWHQSISGRRSFAEILFGSIEEDLPSSKEALLRGCSLHKVCSGSTCILYSFIGVKSNSIQNFISTFLFLLIYPWGNALDSQIASSNSSSYLKCDIIWKKGNLNGIIIKQMTIAYHCSFSTDVMLHLKIPLLFSNISEGTLLIKENGILISFLWLILTTVCSAHFLSV